MDQRRLNNACFCSEASFNLIPLEIAGKSPVERSGLLSDIEFPFPIQKFSIFLSPSPASTLMDINSILKLFSTFSLHVLVPYSVNEESSERASESERTKVSQRS